MKSEITMAQARGEKFGREEGIDFVAFDPAAQLELDRIYNEQALKEARRFVSPHGGSAERVLARAQEVVAALKAGQPVQCGGGGA